MITRLVRLAAFVCYLISFSLPAIQMVDTSGGPGSGAVEGWACAFIASITAFIGLARAVGQGMDGDTLLIPLSGMLNYLFIAICILSIWPRLRRTRLVLGALMLPCFAATWIFFAHTHTRPLVGHFVWVAACVLVVVPDAVDALRESAV